MYCHVFKGVIKLTVVIYATVWRKARPFCQRVNKWFFFNSVTQSFRCEGRDRRLAEHQHQSAAPVKARTGKYVFKYFCLSHTRWHQSRLGLVNISSNIFAYSVVIPHQVTPVKAWTGKYFFKYFCLFCCHPTPSDTSQGLDW